jgi:hypothetical protein
LLDRPSQQALVLGAIGGSIQEQKIKIATHPGRAAAVAAKQANPLQRGALGLLGSCPSSYF